MPFDGKPDLFVQKDPVRETPTEQIIRRARGLISTPKTWCRNAHALDANRRWMFSVHDDRAVRFCANGALKRAARELDYSWLRYRWTVYTLGGYTLVASTNDRQGLRAVHRLFDKRLAKTR